MNTFGSLFAGIGGIDLGLERAGWTCRWQVEWDPFCTRVLTKHWPDIPKYGDIRAVDWSTVEPIDLLAGGFPCQPVSVAGKQLAQADERWLWPEFARAIRVLRPRLVFVENVPGLLGAHGGFGDVLGDLAALGYDAEWDCIPAAAVGAPHLRYRVYVVAYPHGSRRPEPFGQFRRGDSADVGDDGEAEHLADSAPLFGEAFEWDEPDGVLPAVPDAESDGWGPGWQGRSAGGSEGPDEPFEAVADTDEVRWRGRAGMFWPGWWRKPPYGGWWESEPNVGRVAHGVPSRVDRLRALGNAVVPQVVEVIGRQLLSRHPR